MRGWAKLGFLSADCVDDSADEERFVLLRKLVLPDANHQPAIAFQSASYTSVAFLISGEFSFPESAVAYWEFAMPWTTVPPTSINEDRDPMLAKHEIGIAKYDGVATPALDSEAPE